MNFYLILFAIGFLLGVFFDIFVYDKLYEYFFGEDEDE